MKHEQLLFQMLEGVKHDVQYMYPYENENLF